MNFAAIDLIETALREDIGTGDITTDYLVPDDLSGKGTIIAKAPLIIAGLDLATTVFRTLDPETTCHLHFSDGDSIEKGAVVMTVEGKLSVLLKGERTALNFLQRLSGIATQVRAYLKEVSETNVRLVDTRKTTPGWRVLEKYAVRVGGASNHRMGLFDGVLIKDNHIAACGGITKAVNTIRRELSHLIKIEVETTTLDEVKEALSAGADVIMLDNMDIPQIKEAVEVIDHRALVEISGGVTKNRLKALADTGVDIISVGALTHSATAVDLSMKIE